MKDKVVNYCAKCNTQIPDGQELCNVCKAIKIIKDSGERREFSSGAVRDMQEGKGRMDLLPWAAVIEVSKHCENGARKYGEHNVDRGIPLHSLCDSAARHLAKFIDGQEDEPHLLAAAWNLLWAIQMQIKHPELCDVPWRIEENKNDETDDNKTTIPNERSLNLYSPQFD